MKRMPPLSRRVSLGRFLVSVAVAVGLLAVPYRASAQSALNVLLVVNSNSRASQEIAEYYAQKRKIPTSNIVRLPMPVEEEVSLDVHQNRIERPILEWLRTAQAEDRILYIVLTKGVPLRIAGTPGMNGTVSSVDSELALLYRKATGVPILLDGGQPNPYFAGDQPLSALQPFSHRTQDIYLVTRLDGFTVTDVKALIDRGVAATRQAGAVLLRTRGDREGLQGDAWLQAASRRLADMPEWQKVPLLWSATRGAPDSPLLGYYSWGSNDPTLAESPEPDVTFAPGAIGGLFVSGDARTFEAPPDGWRPGQAFRGSNQSLVGVLIRKGITGVAGHVAEPFLTGTARPDILFPAYLLGFNLAEAFYLAIPTVGWQNVIVGDPLCAPFRQTGIPAEDLDPGSDPVTELPRFLSDRRVSLLTKSGVQAEAARFFIRADVLAARRDADGAREALEEAVRIDTRFTQAEMALAMLLEQGGNRTSAVERYRRVVELDPNNVIALNNLAYNLAVHAQNPKEALPFARRAFSLAPNTPDIADTLGWVHHLLGDNTSAESILVRALSIAPDHVELLIHAATVLDASGKKSNALSAVERALKINPAIRSRDDVRRLMERLAVTIK
jgi:uncharacterized protein (TIGR03790 family)